MRVESAMLSAHAVITEYWQYLISWITSQNQILNLLRVRAIQSCPREAIRSTCGRHAIQFHPRRASPTPEDLSSVICIISGRRRGKGNKRFKIEAELMWRKRRHRISGFEELPPFFSCRRWVRYKKRKRRCKQCHAPRGTAPALPTFSSETNIALLEVEVETELNL